MKEVRRDVYSKLESLRGLAALAVVLYHTPYHWSEAPIQIVKNSYLFVDLFFILSGLVMSTAYSNRIMSGLSFKSYFTVRFFRLYPLHLFSLLLMLGYMCLKTIQYNLLSSGSVTLSMSDIPTFLGQLLLLQSFGIFDSLSWNTPSWSIGAEMFSYILFFIFTISLDRERRLFFPLTVSLLSYGSIILLGRDSLDVTFDYGFIRCLGGFYLGVALHRWKHRPATTPISKRYLSIIELLTCVVVVGAVTLASGSSVGWLVAIFSFVLAIIVCTNHMDGFIGDVLKSSPILSLGRYSYSLYMLHYLVILIGSNIISFFHLDPYIYGINALITNILLVAASIIVSRYSYLYIEEPWRKKGKALSQKITVDRKQNLDINKYRHRF